MAKIQSLNKSISDISLNSCIFSDNEGFDSEIFINESAAEKYFCVLCQAIAREPLETSCGHIFCKGCYNEYIEICNKPIPCPTCRKDVESTFVSQRMSREINNLRVKCVNHDSECDWKGSLSDIKKHIINDCSYTFMVCKYCNDKQNPYHRMNQKKHYKVCGKFPIICKLCQNVIKRENYDKHVNIECEMILILCPNKCGKTIKKGELELHISKYCLNRDVKCLYYHYGCNKKLKNGNIKQHLKNDTIYHLELKISYLERLTKSTELISIKDLKNKHVNRVICGLYVRQNRPYMGKPWYKHINKDKRFVIRWDMNKKSWLLMNEVNSTIIAYKTGNFSTPLCKNNEYCINDMSYIDDDDEEIIFLNANGDEKDHDNDSKDDNNNDNHHKSDKNWYLKKQNNKILYMEGYSQKEWDLEWELLKGQTKTLPKPKYKTACICGKYLIESKNDNKQNKLVCHHCDSGIFYNLKYYKCPVGNASLSHLQGYDLCMICTKILQDVQISGLKKMRRVLGSSCPCGETLFGSNASFTYGHARAVRCNECKQTFKDPVTILHCKKLNKIHPNGYDLCLQCAVKPKKVSGFFDMFQ